MDTSLTRKEIKARLHPDVAPHIDEVSPLELLMEQIKNHPPNYALTNELLLHGLLRWLHINTIFRLYLQSSLVRRIIHRGGVWRALSIRDLGPLPIVGGELAWRVHYLRTMHFPIAGVLYRSVKEYAGLYQHIYDERWKRYDERMVLRTDGPFTYTTGNKVFYNDHWLVGSLSPGERLRAFVPIYPDPEQLEKVRFWGGSHPDHIILEVLTLSGRWFWACLDRYYAIENVWDVQYMKERRGHPPGITSVVRSKDRESHLILLDREGRVYLRTIIGFEATKMGYQQPMSIVPLPVNATIVGITSTHLLSNTGELYLINYNTTPISVKRADPSFYFDIAYINGSGYILRLGQAHSFELRNESVDDTKKLIDFDYYRGLDTRLSLAPHPTKGRFISAPMEYVLEFGSFIRKLY